MVSLQWRLLLGCLLLGCLAIALWAGSGLGLAQQWNEFRGPGGTGVASATNLPEHWDAAKNVFRKTAVPGWGWSSPVVGGDQVWLTSAVETELNPAEREERMKSARIPGLVPVKSIDLFAFCFDAKTGELRAELKLGETSDPHLIHNLNSFSSPTPLLTDGLLLMVSDRGIATCLDAKSGEQHWRDRLGGDFASPPILADGEVFVGNRKGEMFVIRPGTEFELLATNQLDEGIMATPAVVAKQLLIRTKNSL